MKKLLAMALAFGLVASLGLTACGKKDEGGSESTAATCKATDMAKNDTKTKCDTAGGKFTPASGTGDTAKAAKCECKPASS